MLCMEPSNNLMERFPLAKQATARKALAQNVQVRSFTRCTASSTSWYKLERPDMQHSAPLLIHAKPWVSERGCQGTEDQHATTKLNVARAIASN